MTLERRHGFEDLPPSALLRRLWPHAVIWLGLASAGFWGCASRDLPALPPAPASRLLPQEYLPPELDVRLRLDLQRIRQGLGATLIDELGQRTTALSLVNGSALGWAFPKATSLWLALRPGLKPELTDNVLVLRGDFSGFRPDQLPDDVWTRPQDLGGLVRKYDRTRLASRSEPSRIYAIGENLLVFVSIAALDSTARIFEVGRLEEQLPLPEQGVVSFAVRVATLRSLMSSRSNKAAKLLERAQSLTGYLELGTGALTGHVSLRYSDPERAERTGKAAILLLAAVREQNPELDPLLEGIRIEVLHDAAWLSFDVAAPVLRQALRCLESSEPCRL